MSYKSTNEMPSSAITGKRGRKTRFPEEVAYIASEVEQGNVAHIIFDDESMLKGHYDTLENARDALALSIRGSKALPSTSIVRYIDEDGNPALAVEQKSAKEERKAIKDNAEEAPRPALKKAKRNKGNAKKTAEPVA